MDKVKLTRLQAQQLQKVLAVEDSPASVMNAHFFALSNREPWGSNYDSLNKLTIDDMARALYVGYEVEETPFDVVRENIARERYETDELNQAFLQGARMALDAFGIQVATVNSASKIDRR